MYSDDRALLSVVLKQ